MVSPYIKRRTYSSHAKENQYQLEYAMNEDITKSHLSKEEDSGNRGNPQNRHKVFATVSMIYHLRNRPSNGCMRYVDTQLS